MFSAGMIHRAAIQLPKDILEGTESSYGGDATPMFVWEKRRNWIPRGLFGIAFPDHSAREENREALKELRAGKLRTPAVDLVPAFWRQRPQRRPAIIISSRVSGAPWFACASTPILGESE